MIVDERMSAFINSFASQNSAKLDELEQFSIETNVPIVRKEMQSLMKFLLAQKKPRNILEVGCAIGFSAILMAENTSFETHITTIEKYEKRIPVAKENFANFALILGEDEESTEHFRQRYFDSFHTIAYGGISFVTTAQAAITAHCQIFTHHIILAQVQIRTSLPTLISGSQHLSL